MKILTTIFLISISHLLALDSLNPILDDVFKAVCIVVGHDDEPGEYRCNGFFIEASGYLITDKNTTLVSNRLFCKWPDEDNHIQYLEAKVVGTHPDYDLALLKVDLADGKSFPFLTLDFNPLYEGQWLMRAEKKSDGSNLATISSLTTYFNEPQGDFLAHEGVVNIGCNDIRIWGAPYLNLEGRVAAFHCGNYRRISYLTAFYPLEKWINDRLIREFR